MEPLADFTETIRRDSARLISPIIVSYKLRVCSKFSTGPNRFLTSESKALVSDWFQYDFLAATLGIRTLLTITSNFSWSLKGTGNHSWPLDRCFNFGIPKLGRLNNEEETNELGTEKPHNTCC